MDRFARAHGGDPRFAVLPGVLHSNPVWGNGTTEYALDALIAAAKGVEYELTVDENVVLPMIYVDDLMRGLILLQEADESILTEPQHGYTMPGLSFTPLELFAEIRKHFPGFSYRMNLNEHMNNFAHLWTDELSTAEPLRDLGYSPRVGMSEMVASVLKAHQKRLTANEQKFKELDSSGDGSIDRAELERYVRRYLERSMHARAYGRPLDALNELFDLAMSELDTNRDGLISLGTFQEWSRTNSVDRMVDRYVEAAASN